MDENCTLVKDICLGGTDSPLNHDCGSKSSILKSWDFMKWKRKNSVACMTWWPKVWLLGLSFHSDFFLRVISRGHVLGSWSTRPKINMSLKRDHFKRNVVFEVWFLRSELLVFGGVVLTGWFRSKETYFCSANLPCVIIFPKTAHIFVSEGFLWPKLWGCRSVEVL